MLIWKKYKEYKLEKYVIKNQKMNKITIETLDKRQKNRYITNKNKARGGLARSKSKIYIEFNYFKWEAYSRQ